MKYLSKLMMLNAAMMLNGSYALAADCSSIQISPTKEQGDKYVYELIQNNGDLLESVSRPTEVRKVMKGSKQYFLSPGKHYLTFSVWKKSDFRNFKRDPRMTADFTTLFMKVDVPSGQAYTIQKEKDQFKLNINEPFDCDVENDALLAAAEQANDTVVLPAKLEYRLRKVTQAMQTHRATNTFPASIEWQFGAALDNNFTSDNEIKVLSVAPMSFASKLKLYAGDKIISVNGEKFTDTSLAPKKAIEKLLANVNIGDQLTLSISRNDTPMELTAKNLPYVLPASDYTIDGKTDTLVTSAALPDVVQYQYNQLLKEIADAHSDAVDKNALLHIKGNESLDPVYGLTGAPKITDSKNGFLASRIYENTPAADIGLQAQDLILAFNHHVISENPGAFLTKNINELTYGDNYTILVERNGQQIELTGAYLPNKFPAFDLTIDLASVDNMNELLINKQIAYSGFWQERNFFNNYGVDKSGRFTHQQSRVGNTLKR